MTQIRQMTQMAGVTASGAGEAGGWAIGWLPLQASSFRTFRCGRERWGSFGTGVRDRGCMTARGAAAAAWCVRLAEIVRRRVRRSPLRSFRRNWVGSINGHATGCGVCFAQGLRRWRIGSVRRARWRERLGGWVRFARGPAAAAAGQSTVAAAGWRLSSFGKTHEGQGEREPAEFVSQHGGGGRWDLPANSGFVSRVARNGGRWAAGFVPRDCVIGGVHSHPPTTSAVRTQSLTPRRLPWWLSLRGSSVRGGCSRGVAKRQPAGPSIRRPRL